MKAKNLKAGTHKLKATITRQLNKLATCIAGSEIKSQQEMEEIKAIFKDLRKKPWKSWKSKGFCMFCKWGVCCTTKETGQSLQVLDLQRLASLNIFTTTSVQVLAHIPVPTDKDFHARKSRAPCAMCCLSTHPPQLGGHVKLGSFMLQLCNDSKEMYIKAQCLCKVVVLLI